MDFPTGIRPSGAGLRIRIWKSGKLYYTETLPGDPYSKAHLAAAVKHRKALMARMAMGLPLHEEAEETPSQLFETAAQAWLNSLQIDTDTRRKYLSIINSRWLPVYHGWPCNQITRSGIKAELAQMGVRIKTQKNYLGPLRMVLTFAGVHPNPATDMDWPKKKTKTDKTRIERFRPAQRDLVIEQLDRIASKSAALAGNSQRMRSQAHWASQARVFYPLLFATGLRPGEALSLTWQDYNGETLNVHATHTRGKRKEQTKTGENRTVYVPKWIRSRLETHPTRFKRGPIFVNTDGQHLNDTKKMNRVWRDALEACSLPDRDPYVCRHTRAAELLSMGVQQAEAASQMGHNVAMFTYLYSEFIEEYAGHKDWSHLEPTDKSPTNLRGSEEKNQ